jgi:hypothetical protein
LIINQRNITLDSITAATKDYDGNSVATISDVSFGNLVSGEALGLSGFGFFDSPNVNGVSTVTVDNVGSLSKVDGTGLWSNYNLTTTGSITSSATGKITPKTLTATVLGSSIFVTQAAASAPDMGVRYTGFVGGDTAETALTGNAVRSYSGAVSYPSVPADPQVLMGVFGLSSTPSANHGNYTFAPVVRGDLTVIPADRLLITINSQALDYGKQTNDYLGVAAPRTVSAVYCLVPTDCNGDNLYRLDTTRINNTNQWQASDRVGGVVVFDTTIGGAIYSSSGRYLVVGNYQFDSSSLTRISTSEDTNLNFVHHHTIGGVLTVNPLTVTPTLSASDQT